ncbi:MAG: Fic family protein [Fibrobacter sp.]|nr:Fic family protein [Fibrobacter sp.]
MLYIHQFPDWTRFRFDSKAIINELGQVRLEEGRLLGISEMLDDDTHEAEITARDIVATYAIDGLQLDSKLVQEQVDKKEKADKAAFRSLMGAVKNFRGDIDEARILGWHASISGKPQRQFRNGPGQVLSRTDNSVVFAGPGPERLQHEMGNFITWLNTAQLDPVLKAAIAQFWFLTIRPFDEANGRIARLITNLLLARAEVSGHLQYSINEQILSDVDNYFRILGAAQCGNGDLTEWILWFLQTLRKAIQDGRTAIKMCADMVKFKGKKSAEGIQPRAQKIVDAVIAGKISHPFKVKDVAQFTGTSHDSALRDIQKLIAQKLVEPSKKGGRSTSYSLVI